VELLLGLAVAKPIELHVNGLGAFWLIILFITPSAVVLSV
jgi:hypothetical protein